MGRIRVPGAVQHATQRSAALRPGHSPWKFSDVAALDLFRELLHQVGDALEVGMHGKRAAEGVVLVVKDRAFHTS